MTIKTNRANYAILKLSKRTERILVIYIASIAAICALFTVMVVYMPDPAIFDPENEVLQVMNVGEIPEVKSILNQIRWAKDY